MTKKITLITSALPYANGPIHIGHLVEYIQTDIYVRFLKLIGENAVYCCADDTHGAPIEINAKKNNTTPEKFIKKWYKEHTQDFSDYNIEFDSYYTTHSEENKHYTRLIFERLKKKGMIYKKDMELTYCTNCKRFLPDRYVKGKCPKCTAEDQYGDVCEKCNATYKPTELIDPYCSICKNPPIRKVSSHYFFRLSSYSEKLKDWLTNNKKLQPEIKNQIMNWIKEGLDDWCISRDSPYFGFKIPGEEDKFFYVWLDAPIGYIASTANYCKNKDCDADGIWQENKHRIIHFIGKDIIYFHLLFWPAVLMGADFNVPENIVVHGFLTVNGEKMSKSRGTFLTAKEFKEYVEPKFLRYYYASNLTHTMTDIDLDLENLKDKTNNELVANIANFIYRVLSFTDKYYEGKITSVNRKQINKQTLKLCKEIKADYLNFNYRQAVKKILEISSIGNKYFQDKKPWELRKNDPEKTQKILTDCINIVKKLAIVLKPVIPDFSEEIEKQLNLEDLSWKDIGVITEKHQIKKPKIILKKIQEINLKTTEKKKDFKIEIGKKLKDKGVKIKAAIIRDVKIRKKHFELQKLKKKIVEKISSKDYDNNKIIQAHENLYKSLGIKNKSPIGALINLVKKNNRFPNINGVVDAYNIVAAKKLVSVGAHDISKISGEKLSLSMTKGNEKYTPLGEKKSVQLNKGEFAFFDQEKVLCYLDIKQCDETKITRETKDIFVYVQGNEKTSEKYLLDSLKEICELITKFNSGIYEILGQDKFSKLNLKVGKILDVSEHYKADKLYVIDISIGKEKRQLIAGLKQFYTKDELIGKKIVVVSNLEHADLRGKKSEGMLLAAKQENEIGLLTAKKSEPGDQVFVEGIVPSEKKISFEEFSDIKIRVREGKAMYKGKSLKTEKEIIKSEKVTKGKVL
ncbi:methionine--tRNA ligase [Candidatus Woesearchaeota archaeon]|nr:methionine--tRNA ligase [Candidatus Woesearchaeota archaeon]